MTIREDSRTTPRAERLAALPLDKLSALSSQGRYERVVPLH